MGQMTIRLRKSFWSKCDEKWINSNTFLANYVIARNVTLIQFRLFLAFGKLLKSSKLDISDIFAGHYRICVKIIRIDPLYIICGSKWLVSMQNFEKPKISSDSLFTMMKDQYANYVVQKMLDIADMPQKKKMISQMKPQLSNLKRYTYGKHIITKLEKIIQSLQMNGNLN